MKALVVLTVYDATTLTPAGRSKVRNWLLKAVDGLDAVQNDPARYPHYGGVLEDDPNDHYPKETE